MIEGGFGFGAGFCGGKEFDLDDVVGVLDVGVGAMSNGRQVVAGRDDRLRVEETGGELDVVAGRSHDDRQGRTVQLDLEGLFRGQPVVAAFTRLVGPPMDAHTGRGLHGGSLGGPGRRNKRAVRLSRRARWWRAGAIRCGVGLWIALGWVVAGAGCGARGGRAARLGRPPAVPTTELPARAVLEVGPFIDARTGADRDDASGRYRYRGRDYRGVGLDGLVPRDPAPVTEWVSAYAETAALFSVVRRRQRPAQATQAWTLSGRIRRLRGYVSEAADTGPPEALAEVWLQDVALSDPSGRVRLVQDVGWTEQRAVPAGTSPEAVLTEALQRGFDRYFSEFRRWRRWTVPSDSMPPVAGAEALARVLPEGFRLGPAKTQRPAGRCGRGRCEALRWSDPKSLFFHRALGPHRDGGLLWRCDAPWQVDPRADFPAEHLGRAADGAYWYDWSLGRTRWKGRRSLLRRVIGAPSEAGRAPVLRGPDDASCGVRQARDTLLHRPGGG